MHKVEILSMYVDSENEKVSDIGKRPLDNAIGNLGKRQNLYSEQIWL